MIFTCYHQLIFILIILPCSSYQSHVPRPRRQTINVNNPNVRVPPQTLDGFVPPNPIFPHSNAYPNRDMSSERKPFQSIVDNNPPTLGSQLPKGPVRSHGLYSNPAFQPSPFTGGKPSGWFGTNRINWVSTHDSEVDKQKLAAMNTVPLNQPQDSIIQPRKDGGPQFLEKVAKAYATKGVKAFSGDQHETRQGYGAVCSNHDYFDGFVFGTFSCPLPPSTGMNQLDQFCCGPANYQYCCNAQEFSQTQRGAFSDQQFGKHGFPTRTEYPSSTKRILAIMAPIAGFIVLAGIISLAFLYYKYLQKERNRIGKPLGATRLNDSYSVIPQEPSVENVILT